MHKVTVHCIVPRIDNAIVCALLENLATRKRQWCQNMIEEQWPRQLDELVNTYNCSHGLGATTKCSNDFHRSIITVHTRRSVHSEQSLDRLPINQNKEPLDTHQHWSEHQYVLGNRHLS